MHRTYPAVPSSIPVARDDVRNRLHELTPDVGHDDLLVAVSEAVTNAVRHSGAGTFVVGVTEDQDGITVTVVDDGRGTPQPDGSMPAPDAHGGRGIPLIHLLVDHAEVTTGPSGTTVTLRRQLVS